MQIPEISVSRFGRHTNTVITQLRPAPPSGQLRERRFRDRRKEWTASARAVMNLVEKEIKSLGKENLQRTLGRDISHGHKRDLLYYPLSLSLYPSTFLLSPPGSSRRRRTSSPSTSPLLSVSVTHGHGQTESGK